MSDTRVQDNVRSMIEQGAPATDIDAYLKTEGHTADTFAKSNSMSSPVENALGWADKNIATPVNSAVNVVGTGLAKGFAGAAGAFGDIRNLAGAGADWIGQKIGDPQFGDIYRKTAGPIGISSMAPKSSDLKVLSPSNPTGPLAMPERNAADIPALTLQPPMLNGGKINVGSAIDAGIQAIPGMMTAGAPSLLPAFSGGVTSDLAGQATKGTPYEIPARILGSIPGYYAGQKFTTPLAANLTPEEQRLVSIAKENPDLKMTIGQETGRGRGVESAIARFPTSQGRMANFSDAQNEQINSLALKQAGAEGTRLDPTSMTDVNQKASAAFEAAKNNSGPVTLGKDFYKALEGTVGKYLENTPPSSVAPVVGNRAKDFVGLAEKTGAGPRLAENATDTVLPELTGAQYQEFRRGLNQTMMNLNPGSGEYQAIKSMRVALDDAMRTSLPADQAAAWDEVRKNWANLKILNKSAAGGSMDSRAAGNLSPAALSTALRSQQGADKFAQATGGMNDVARLAAYLADKRPNSGTPQTLMMQSMLTGGPIGAGFAVGGLPGAAAAGGAMMLPNLGARITTGSTGFDWIRSYLANQSIPNQGLAQLPQSTLPGVLGTNPYLPRLRDRRNSQ